MGGTVIPGRTAWLVLGEHTSAMSRAQWGDMWLERNMGKVVSEEVREVRGAETEESAIRVPFQGPGFH